MPFDFGVHDNILIELDGRQHFGQVSNWGDHEDIQKKDVEKIKLCIQNGKSIIHLLQEDVWYNRYDWKATLIREIEELVHSQATKCILLQTSDEYQSHIEKLGGEMMVDVKNPTA